MRGRAAVITGITLIIAALLLVLIVVPRLTKTEPNPSKAASLAHEGCIAFADVYEATRPGTPTDTERLAKELERAIVRLKLAASADERWQPLRDAVVRAGDAVNQGDTAGAAAAFSETHERCRSTRTS